MIEFQAWPKTPRLHRTITITEKIDGTNACIVIEQHQFGTHAGDFPPQDGKVVFSSALDDCGDPVAEYLVAAQSRKRMITPQSDNAGFAQWIDQNTQSLVDELGAGHHFGEWFGSGIQRGYGLADRHFALFNTRRWWNKVEFTTPGLGIVPVLYNGLYHGSIVDDTLRELRSHGTYATIGRRQRPIYPAGSASPEGICVFFHDAGQVFKVLVENDEVPKSLSPRTFSVAAGTAEVVMAA